MTNDQRPTTNDQRRAGRDLDGPTRPATPIRRPFVVGRWSVVVGLLLFELWPRPLPLLSIQVDPLHAELVVSDQGPGIPPEERHLVFDRFFRSASARAMPGSGLGLAIVKQVVTKHGGTLRVEDTVVGGQPPGASIHVVLPGRPMPGTAAAPVDGRHAFAGVDAPDPQPGDTEHVL